MRSRHVSGHDKSSGWLSSPPASCGATAPAASAEVEAEAETKEDPVGTV
jgi:hypothetical protein